LLLTASGATEINSDSLGVIGRLSVVVARALVAQSAVDYHKVRGWSGRYNLAGRTQAQQQATPAGEELLSYQDGERRTERASDDAYDLSSQVQHIKSWVVAWPSREGL
jgi:hypothetical protein